LVHGVQDNERSGDGSRRNHQKDHRELGDSLVTVT
jgi:hypothetical protein